MDDVSSETCFAFIKKYWRNELQKHRVFHESDILLRAAAKPLYIYICIYIDIYIYRYRYIDID